jgi:uncharacterized protein (DUF1778 family)
MAMTARDATIHIRAPKKTKEINEAAAASAGKSLSEFMLESARQQAVDVLLDQRLFALEPERYAEFTKALDDAPPAGPKLKALLRRRPLWQT